MATRALCSRLFLTVCFIYGAFLLALQLSLRQTLQPQSPALLEFSLTEDTVPSLKQARNLHHTPPKSDSDDKRQNARAARRSVDAMSRYNNNYNATIRVRHLHANSVLMRRLKETKQHLAAKVKEVSVLPSFGKPPPPNRHLVETVDFLELHEDFYVFSAFWDTRSSFPSTLRILALCPSFEYEPSWAAFCHFDEALSQTITQNQHKHNHQNTIKRGDGFPLRVEAQKYAMCENHGKKYGGWILTCPVPRGFNASTISMSITVKNYAGTTYTPKLNLPLKRIRGRDQNALVDTVIRQSQSRSEKGLARTTTSKSGVRINSMDNYFIKSRLRKDATKPIKELKYENNAGPKSSSQYHANDSDVIGVCVPPLHGNVDLTRIVNFVEMTRILGARQVFLYINDISIDMRQLLEEYVQLDSTSLKLIDWKLPVIETDPKPTTPSDSTQLPASEVIWNRGQLPAVQHCLYANMDAFDWLLFMDVDEMLFPRDTFTWHELFSQATKRPARKPTGKVTNERKLSPKVAGLVFESAVFHPDSQSQALYTIDYFQKLSRAKQTDKTRTKLAVRPEAVFEMGIHHLSKAFAEGGMTVQVPSEVALVHHYRDDESSDQSAYYFTEETALFYDNSAVKYETLLTETSQSVMNALGKIMVARTKVGISG